MCNHLFNEERITYIRTKCQQLRGYDKIIQQIHIRGSFVKWNPISGDMGHFAIHEYEMICVHLSCVVPNSLCIFAMEY